MKDLKKTKNSLFTLSFFSWSGAVALIAALFIIFIFLPIGCGHTHADTLTLRELLGMDSSAPLSGEGIANSFGDLALRALAFIFGALKNFAAWLLVLAQDLLGAVFNKLLQKEVFDTPFVRDAWEKMRDFANMFFILWLVIIALATILNIKDWQAKKLLPRMIAVALIINFSLVFSMVIIDFANTSIALFAHNHCQVPVIQSSGEEATEEAPLQACLVRGLRVDQIVKDKSGGGSYEGINFDSPAQDLLDNLAGFLILLIAAAVFLLLSVMMVVRIIALWLLMIIAPIALVIGIIPPLAQYTKQWWSNFIKWAFYGLPVAFVLNVAVKIVSSFNKTNTQAEEHFTAAFSGGGGAGGGFNMPLFAEATKVVQYFIVVALMFIAFKVAQSSASDAGDFITSTAAGWGEKGAKGFGRWTRGQTTGRAGRNLSIGAAKATESTLGAVENVPLIGGAAGRSKAAVGEWRGKRQADKYSRERKRLSNLPPEQLMQEAKSGNTEAQRIAAERHWTKNKAELPTDDAQKWYENLSAYPEVRDTLGEDRPDAAGKQMVQLDIDEFKVRRVDSNGNRGSWQKEIILYPGDSFDLKWKVVNRQTRQVEDISRVDIKVSGHDGDIPGVQNINNREAEDDKTKVVEYTFSLSEDKVVYYQIIAEPQGGGGKAKDSVTVNFAQ